MYSPIDIHNIANSKIAQIRRMRGNLIDASNNKMENVDNIYDN